MKYKKTKFAILLITIAVLLLPIYFGSHNLEWLITSTYEIVAYVLMIISSLVICFEIEKHVSGLKWAVVLLIINALVVTCAIILYNNILLYIADYALYKDVMEWSLVDMIVRNLDYYNGLGLYRYFLCWLLILAASAFIMICKYSNRAKQKIWNIRVNLFFFACKLKLECLFKIVILDGPSGFGKTQFIKRLKSMTEEENICIITGERFGEYLYNMLRNGDNSTAIVEKLGHSSKFLVIEDIDMALSGEMAQEVASDILLNAIEDDDKVVIVTGINIKEKAPEFYWNMIDSCGANLVIE